MPYSFIGTRYKSLVPMVQHIICHAMLIQRFETKSDSSFQVASGGFQWQILVAALVAGFVFLILGIVCSAFVRRRHNPKKVSVRNGNGYQNAVENVYE